MSHRGSSRPARVTPYMHGHPCVVFAFSLSIYLPFFSVLSFFFQTFLKPFSVVLHKKFMSQNLRNSRSGTVGSNAHETPRTDCWQLETNGQCVKGNNCSFRHDMDKRGKSSPSNPSPNSFTRQSERKPSRTRSPKGKSLSGRMSRWPCKDYLRGTCNNSFCHKWQPPECLFYKTKNGCRLGEKCSYAHRQVDEQPSKRFKKNGDKSAVAKLEKHELYDRTEKPVVCNASNTRQLGCVSQNMEPPKLTTILRKTLHIRKAILCKIHQKLLHVSHTFETRILRSDIFAQVNFISAAPTLQNLRIGLRRRQSGKSKVPAKQRGDWPKLSQKLKDQERATFFSPSENRCLLASSLKPGEREFVLDSGASMHMI